MNPVLASRFLRRMAFVAPFIVAMVAFRAYTDAQRGESLRQIVLFNGVPLLFMGGTFTAMLWWVSRPIVGVRDAEAAIAIRTTTFTRKAALVSLVAHAVLAIGVLLAALTR